MINTPNLMSVNWRKKQDKLKDRLVRFLESNSQIQNYKQDDNLQIIHIRIDKTNKELYSIMMNCKNSLHQNNDKN
ncbi:MAG: hypothetical protein ABI851_06105 [Saprospiraceae bacterium]